MKLLMIEKTNGKYLKNGKIISKKRLYEELSKYNIEQLENNGSCKIRDKSESKAEVTKVSKREQNKLDRQQKKDEKTLKSIRDDYKVKNHYYSYHDKHQIELYRYNKKGFYNFVTILKDNRPETIDKAILDDFRKVQKQKPVKKENDDGI